MGGGYSRTNHVDDEQACRTLFHRMFRPSVVYTYYQNVGQFYSDDTMDEFHSDKPNGLYPLDKTRAQEAAMNEMQEADQAIQRLGKCRSIMHMANEHWKTARDLYVGFDVASGARLVDTFPENQMSMAGIRAYVETSST